MNPQILILLPSSLFLLVCIAAEERTTKRDEKLLKSETVSSYSILNIRQHNSRNYAKFKRFYVLNKSRLIKFYDIYGFSNEMRGS